MDEAVVRPEPWNKGKLVGGQRQTGNRAGSIGTDWQIRVESGSSCCPHPPKLTPNQTFAHR